MTPISADELEFDLDGPGAIGADDLAFDQPPAPRAKKPKTAKPEKPTLGEMQERARTFKPLQDPAPGYDLRFDQEPSGVVLQFPKGDSFKAQSVTMVERGAGGLKPRVAGVRREEGESLDSFLRRSETWHQGEQARKKGERAELAQVRAKTTPSRGPIGRVAEGFKTGLGEAIRTTGVGASLITGQEPDSVALKQPLPTMNEEDAKGWLSKGGQGLGSMIFFMLGSAAIGPTAVTLMGAAQNAGQTYEEARGRGVSHDEALAAAIPGALIGALEGLGGGGGKATGFLKGTLGEGGQEGLSQVLNNINAKFISGYDPQRAITEGVFESAMLGGLLGAGVHGVGAALAGKPAAIPPSDPQMDDVTVGQVETKNNPSFISDPVERQANLLVWHKGADRSVKTPDGTPKVFYHGTRVPDGKGIEQFDFEQISRPGNGYGFHFAESSDLGSQYAYQDLKEGDGGQVVPVYLNIQKPARPSVYTAASNRVYRQYKEERAKLSRVEWTHFAEKKIREDLESQGYDGILHQSDGLRGGGNGGNVLVAFYPEQIKSATGNEGAFNSKDPRLSASFTSGQLLEMEQKAVQAGRPVALRQVTKESFQQQIGAIQQELMRVDPTSPEFARLADRAVQLKQAVEEAPTPGDLKDGKSMREWARRNNLWHDGAADELLGTLGITDESGQDVSLPGIKANWDLFNRNLMSGERGARFYPLPADQTKGGTVFLSPQSMVDSGVMSAEELTSIGGMNASVAVAKDYARMAELGGYQDVAGAIRGAIAEAEQKGLPKISIARYVPGQGLGATREFVRHESFHSGQQAAADAAAPLETDIWNDPQRLISQEFLYHPTIAMISQTKGGQSVLQYYHGDQAALALEMAAYAAGGQYPHLGWSKEEADNYLADYLMDVLETSGVEALEGLAKGARLSAPVAQQVTKLTENYYGRERTRRDRANSFAASLRAPSSTAGPEDGAGGGGREDGGVGEGRAGERGVKNETGNLPGKKTFILDDYLESGEAGKILMAAGYDEEGVQNVYREIYTSTGERPAGNKGLYAPSLPEPLFIKGGLLQTIIEEETSPQEFLDAIQSVGYEGSGYKPMKDVLPEMEVDEELEVMRALRKGTLTVEQARRRGLLDKYPGIEKYAEKRNPSIISPDDGPATPGTEGKVDGVSEEPSQSPVEELSDKAENYAGRLMDSTMARIAELSDEQLISGGKKLGKDIKPFGPGAAKVIINGETVYERSGDSTEATRDYGELDADDLEWDDDDVADPVEAELRSVYEAATREGSPENSARIKVVRGEGVTPGVSRNSKKGIFYYPADSRNGRWIRSHHSDSITEVDLDLGKSLQVQNKVEALRKLGAPDEYIAGHLNALDEDIEDSGGLAGYVDGAIRGGAFGPSETWDAEIAKRARKAGYDTIQYAKEPDGGGGFGPEIVDLRVTPPTPPTTPTPTTGGTPGSPLTETVVAKDRYAQLREKLMQAAVAKGYKYDPLVPPGIQLAQAIEKGHLDLDSIAEEMAKSGMSVNDLANLAEFTQHRAGQILNELSKLSKTVRDLIQTNPVAATAIVGPNKVMQEGLKILERTELGHSMWERMGNVMRKNFLSRLSTTFTQVWSTTGQIPMDIASGAIAGLAMRRLNPARWQSNTKGMLARAKEDVTRGVLPVITLARGMNPKQVGDLIKLQTPSQQAEYRQMVDDLSLLHPELYGKLHGREDLALSAPGFMSPAMLRQVLPMVQDPAKRREFEVKLRILEGRERINKSIVGKAFKGYEKALDIVLWPLSVQEYAFRRPMFIGALQRELEAKGHDLNAFIADPSSVAGAKDILQSAVDEALRFTWAYEPKEGNKAVGQTEQAMEGAASYFIKFWNKLGPIGATLEAFPRALTNGLKFAYEWSPFGFISPAWQVQDKLRHGARDQITFQEAQRMSQAVVGTAMYGLALGLREWAGGEEWWQIKTGKKTKDGKPVYYDARRIPQLAFFLNAADLAKRASEDRLGDIKVEQRLKDTYLGARRNSQPGDLGAIDQFMLMWTGDTVPTNAKQRSQLAAGQWASTFVIPLSNIRDAWAQFNEQEGAKRDLREQPWLGPSLDKLPWLRRNLPLAEGPFEPSPQGANYAPIAEGEGIGPITGAFALAGATGAAKFTPGQSFAAQEFARLGLSPYTWLKRDPDPAIDRAQWKRMTTILQAIGNSLANSESYRNQSPDQQRAIWESIIGGAEGAAAEAKAAGLETNPMEAERRKTLQAVPPYQRKAIGLDKKLAPMQQP